MSSCRQNAVLPEALPESLARYRSIVENAVEGVFQSTPDGRYLLVNPALARLYGYDSPEELLAGVSDISLAIYVDPAAREEFKRLMLRDGEVHGLEYEVRRKDGSTLWISEHARAVRDEAGGVLYYEGFVQDITRRRRAEDALRAAKEAAEVANRAKSQFLAVMSHEIRTPMNGVIGMASLLLDSPLSAEQRDFVEIIRQSGDSLLAVINDILDFSKIESGRIELEDEEFTLRECVESALDLLAPRASEKGLDLLYEIDEGAPRRVSGDSTRLRQVLVNLLGNAVKFTERGEVVLSLRAEPAEGEGLVRLHFTVRDTGVGIPADSLGRLFQSFSQVDASTTRRFGGTGLGLAISKRLAELMGGGMSVESEEGRGATFHFSILVKVAETAPDAVTEAPERAVIEGRRLLIVDDNATNRRILTTLARAHGVGSYAVASGPEALAVLATGERFDFAILDMQMPDMDGEMLARAIRREHPDADLPLVLLSSLGQRELIGDRGLFFACLTKPAKPAQIVDVLAQAAAHPGRRTNRAPAGAARPGSSPRFRGERVLLAEDNAVNQKVALHMLAHLGYRADVAANGHEVLAALRRQPYDIVLMDVQMPEMDGCEATTRLRADGLLRARGRPWVIALTANAVLGDRERCLAAGMDDYVSKPIKIPDLTAALERARARVCA